MTRTRPPQTCIHCGKGVSMNKRPWNRERFADGSVGHVQCDDAKAEKVEAVQRIEADHLSAVRAAIQDGSLQRRT